MALKLAPAIEVSLIVYTWPLLLALYVANSNTRLYALIGGSLGFIGISFIILSDNPLAMNKQGFYGYLLSLVAALIWASYSWFLSRSKGSVDDIGWLSVAVSLSALVAHLSLEPSSWQLSVNQWSGVLLLGLGPVGGAFYLWDLGLKNGNKTLLASLSFSAPLISSVLLALAGYNKWSTDILIALGFVLIGAIIANKKPSVSRKTASLK
jgi:drug/metabolite transporter (DMT)-like permease